MISSTARAFACCRSAAVPAHGLDRDVERVGRRGDHDPRAAPWGDRDHHALAHAAANCAHSIQAYGPRGRRTAHQFRAAPGGLARPCRGANERLGDLKPTGQDFSDVPSVFRTISNGRRASLGSRCARRGHVDAVDVMRSAETADAGRQPPITRRAVRLLPQADRRPRLSFRAAAARASLTVADRIEPTAVRPIRLSVPALFERRWVLAVASWLPPGVGGRRRPLTAVPSDRSRRAGRRRSGSARS